MGKGRGRVSGVRKREEMCCKARAELIQRKREWSERKRCKRGIDYGS